MDAVGPTLVEYRVLFGSKRFDLLTSTRTVLPWQITGIQAVFSEPITVGKVGSLTGITASRLIGLKTKTLTWKFSGITKGEFSTALAHTGANALKDKAGNPIAAFSLDFDVLYGDYNQDRVVNLADELAVRSNVTGPYQPAGPGYNIFADLRGTAGEPGGRQHRPGPQGKTLRQGLPDRLRKARAGPCHSEWSIPTRLQTLQILLGRFVPASGPVRTIRGPTIDCGGRLSLLVEQADVDHGRGVPSAAPSVPGQGLP